MQQYMLNNGTTVTLKEHLILKACARIKADKQLRKDQGLWLNIAGVRFKETISDLIERGLLTKKQDKEDPYEFILKTAKHIMPSFEPTTYPLKPGHRKPVIANNNKQDPGEIAMEALINQAKTPVYANKYMIKKLHANWKWDRTVPDAVKSSITQFRAWLKKQDDNAPIHSDAYADWRGRINLASGTFGSYQHNRLIRACLDGPQVPVDVNSDEYNYFLTIIAEEYEVSPLNYDKILTSDIKTTKDALAHKAALAIHEIRTTGKTGYLVEQDASCSGGQIIALLTGDKKLARLTNATITDTKQDFYSHIASQEDCAQVLHHFGIDDPSLQRTAAKPIIMVSFYGGHTSSIINKIWIDNDGKFEEAKDASLRTITQPTGQLYWLGQMWEYEDLQRLVETMAAHVNRFPGFRAIKSIMSKWFNEAPKRESDDKDANVVTKLEWTTANGMQIQRFVDGSGGCMPNFVHSVDAAIVQRTTNQCADEKLYLLTVHDAFVTTINSTFRIRDIVRTAYADVIRETQLPTASIGKKQTIEDNESMLNDLQHAVIIGEHHKAATVAV